MPSSKATDVARPAKAGVAGKRGTRSIEIRFKRVYDAPDPADGQRILADRLWPRGLAKVKAHVDFWAKDVTPSTPLRQWFHQHPEHFDEFRQRFLDELSALDADHNAMLAELRTRLADGPVTLLTAAHRLEDDEAHTHLHVLRDFLESR
ncbi:DUF488 domain-containing protein [Pandoraea apista]|uniref:DUF488 domain-containing protein n=1 Tax=Pandoraea apista TaxID=93218 RepID=UPI00065841C4|nr:DUF488 family protein [Pandoraea apista]AVF39349.1 DUF488 domain-containing protein [Pandoraea apista]RRW97766.1 DUF488 family protein [Pandoraea apista]RRX06960.1 DUF488 family protein [Pandoraea apista]CFB62392.1 hypothetical protein LMG16407_02465 [Pandoraea apista]